MQSTIVGVGTTQSNNGNNYNSDNNNVVSDHVSSEQLYEERRTVSN